MMIFYGIFRLWNIDTKVCVQEMTAHRPKNDEAVHYATFHINKGNSFHFPNKINITFKATLLLLAPMAWSKFSCKLSFSPIFTSLSLSLYFSFSYFNICLRMNHHEAA